jgi:dTMP kinase
MLWITFEGLDGCGKSTQARLLAEAIDAVLTREPGGTALGATLRSELLSDRDEAVSMTTEMLLYAADRSHNFHNVVQPALESGKPVVSDRSVWSSVAYQGFGRELGADVVIAANEIALGGSWPDVVVFIDADQARRSQRMQRELDRIERSGDAFFERAETGFRLLAAQQGWVVVDGDADVLEVHRQVVESISAAAGERFVRLLGTNGHQHEN